MDIVSVQLLVQIGQDVGGGRIDVGDRLRGQQHLARIGLVSGDPLADHVAEQIGIREEQRRVPAQDEQDRNQDASG